MKKEICAYDRANKALADHYCCECGLPLCSSCGYIDPAPEIKDGRLVYSKDLKHYCNECFAKKFPNKV